MPPYSLSSSPPLAERSIVRSRSRYKGPRPRETPTNLSEPPSFSAEPPQRLQSLVPSPREPRSQNDKEDKRQRKIPSPRYEVMQMHRTSADDAQRPDAFVAQERWSMRKAKNHTGSQDEVVPPSQVLHGHQRKLPHRRSDAEAKSHKAAGQDVRPGQKPAASSEQYASNLESDLPSLHMREAAATNGSFAFHRSGLTQRIAGRSDRKRLHKDKEQLKRTISAPIALQSPQDAAKPAFDAPVSAVNAGERRVNVKFDQKLISFPITPSTTPLEIIRFAADQLAESIDPNGTVLLESFRQLGLERPLRRYEHVRDVLNSWDNDTQNTLVIKQSPARGRHDSLDLYPASTFQPVDTSVYIYYSQRPGRWDKRWVTLRSDGQMLLAKKEGGENSNICHMSDFDIYIPTARQSTKRIKPPKKTCFAVKSQQRSSMFLSTANFVHFFSTSDKTLAMTWYKAVLEWRSWYLVNVMGNGEAVPQGLKLVSTKVGSHKGSNNGLSKLESSRRLPERPPHSIKTKTISALANYDTERLAPCTNCDSSHDAAGCFMDNMLFRSRSEIKSLNSKKPAKDAELGAPMEQRLSFVQSEEHRSFAATGLLDRTYTQRQKAQQEREKAPNTGPDQLTATRNISPIDYLNRTLSQHAKPKPLIDLTPQYQEPPQHARKGRGVILKQVPAGGLIEVANTPEAAIAIPPSSTWRRPTSRGGDRAGDRAGVGQFKIMRRDHSSGTRSEPKQTAPSLENGGMPFTGGLLASNSRGQWGARMGRGTMTGNRQAEEPMLNVGEEHQYTPGSLLERVERQDVRSHPIGERRNKREMVAAVDEGTHMEN